MGLITQLKNDILKYLTGEIKTVSGGTGESWLGFSSTVPNADGTNFTEPDPELYPSYQRIQMNIQEATKYTNMWTPVANGIVSNAKELNTPECKEEGGWPEFLYFGVFNSKTDNVPRAFDLLTDPDGEPDPVTGKYPEKPLKVANNHAAFFRIGTLRLELK